MLIKTICISLWSPDTKNKIEDISRKTTQQVKESWESLQDAFEKLRFFIVSNGGYQLSNYVSKVTYVVPLTKVVIAKELQKKAEELLSGEVGVGIGYLPEQSELAAIQGYKRESKIALYHPHMEPSHQRNAAKDDVLQSLWQEEADGVDLPFAQGGEDFYSSDGYSAKLKKTEGGMTSYQGRSSLASAEDGEVQAYQDELDSAKSLKAPVEATHANQDFLDFLRSHKQPSGQPSGEVAIVGGLPHDIEHDIQMAISEVHALEPELNKLKETDPAAYQAVHRLLDAAKKAVSGGLQKNQDRRLVLEKTLQALRKLADNLKKEEKDSRFRKRFTAATLPVGSVRNGGSGVHGREGTVKIQHSNGKTDWISARDGLIQGTQDRNAKPILGQGNGHPISVSSPER